MSADGIGFLFISVRQWCRLCTSLAFVPELEALNDLLDITCFVLPQSSDGVNFGCHLQFSNHFRDLKSQCLG